MAGIQELCIGLRAIAAVLREKQCSNRGGRGRGDE